jgi:hypothetical protein
MKNQNMRKFTYGAVIASLIAIPLVALAADPNPNTCTTVNGVQVCAPQVAQNDTTQTTQVTQTITPQGDSTGDTSQTTQTTTASPYQFQSDGIFSCQGGQYAQSIGAQAAQGGVYVPVADATVELNTGILVYKECILRPTINKMSANATIGLAKQQLNQVNSGRNGSALYVQQYIPEELAILDQSVVKALQGDKLNTLNPALKDAVLRSVARSYYGTTRQSNQQLACPYDGDLNALYYGQSFSFEGFLAEGNPACNPLFAGNMSYEGVMADAALAVQDWQTQLNWGNGFYPVQTLDDNGNLVTVTPSYLVAQNTVQAVQSGFYKTEIANDIGQMVGALFAGLSNQVIQSSNGLSGISQAAGGQPSYLDRASAEESKGLVNAAANAAIAILNSALAIETSYNQTISAIATNLIGTIGQLRGAENQCWALIVQKTCTASPSGGICTDTSGNTLRVATSTAFSQTIVNSQIASLATTTLTGLQKSNLALQQINQIIKGVTNVSSIDAQRLALQQLDTLTAKGAIHTQTDLTNLQQQQAAIKSTMTDLVQNTAKAWGDGTPNQANPYDAASGWCNVNDPNTISMWDQLWKK